MMWTWGEGRLESCGDQLCAPWPKDSRDREHPAGFLKRDISSDEKLGANESTADMKKVCRLQKDKFTLQVLFFGPHKLTQSPFLLNNL